MSAAVRTSTVSIVQVVVQLTGVAMAIWPWDDARGVWPVLGLCVAGAALGVWTLTHNHIGNFSVFPEPRAGARLITTGPYAHVRHPMYGALVLMMLGIAAWHGHVLNVAGFVMVAIAVFTKAVREERFMMERFPEYAAYRERTLL